MEYDPFVRLTIVEMILIGSILDTLLFSDHLWMALDEEDEQTNGKSKAQEFNIFSYFRTEWKLEKGQLLI